MDGKHSTRRFVQSTLFPHRGSSAKEDENCDAGDGEEEACSSGRKRRKTANSKPKTTPRASYKKVKVNGKESKQVDGGDSSVPDKSNFFMKTSERVQQKGKENPLAIIDSPDGTDETCSSPSPAASRRSTPQKLRCRGNSTPRKKRRYSTPDKKTKNGKGELFSGQLSFEVAADEQLSQTIPDLRMEAKLSVEENSNGLRVHPFFMAWKGCKTDVDITDSENKCSSFERKKTGIPFNPIHVFENVEDDQKTVDWGHWTFSESSTGGDLDCGYSAVYEGSIDSLNFGNFLNNSHSTRLSLYKNCHRCSTPQREVDEELPCKQECSVPIVSLTSADERVAHNEPEKDPDFMPEDTDTLLAGSPLEDNKFERNDQFTGISCGGSFDSELQEKLLHERTISHHHACHSQPENCLWTDKYQPQNADQVCGNGESVKFLSQWLNLWHRRGALASKRFLNGDNLNTQVMDRDCQQSDSDYDVANDEDDLKNVLLVTGPVGSGKSAAIYACARDQGFHIIEINTSDWRNGALVRQRFGEAMESHWLHRTAVNATSLDIKNQSKLFKAVYGSKNCSDNEEIDLSDEEDSQEACAWSKPLVPEKNITADYQNEIISLILFEDVDATLYEDHGFITTIQQLAATAKRPIILTSNNDNPVLPKNLDRSELRFSVPSWEELLDLVYTIFASEKAKIHPSFVERFVDHCKGDIRKTILLLQFWCQGRTLGRDYPRNGFQTTNSPVQFDLDAGHHILPKVICCAYPSKLSELVAEGFAKPLMEKVDGQMNNNRVEDQNNYKIGNALTMESEPNPVEVKKKAILRLHCPRDESAQLEVNSELYDFSCSPVASTQKKGRRKMNTVLSSDSEDGFSGCSIPQNSAGGNNDVEVIDLNKVPTSPHLSDQSTRLTCRSEIENSEDLGTRMNDCSTGPTLHSEVEKLGDQCTQNDLSSRAPYHSEVDKLENQFLLWERVDYSHTEDNKCNSQDISLVPESSVVPETEIIEEELHSDSVTVSHGRSSNAMDSMPILESDFDANSSRLMHIQEAIGINPEPSTTFVCQEEIGDSLSKSEDVPSRYQFLDECSRVDFIKGSKSLDNPEADQAVDFVKGKLYDQSNDLRMYVTAEEKTACQVLNLVCRMSNLISEADLLLKDCRTFLSDSSESYIIPGDKIHSSYYYESQLEMSSVLALHGICLYSKEVSSLGLTWGSTNTSDLASEMLLVSANSIALGTLVSQDKGKVARLDLKTTRELNLLTSGKSDSHLSNILETIVPPRLHLAARRDAFHEYISALSQISRIDTSLSPECSENKRQRRARARRHYLSSGSLALAPEEISVLGRCNSYRKCKTGNV